MLVWIKVYFIQLYNIKQKYFYTSNVFFIFMFNLLFGFGKKGGTTAVAESQVKEDESAAVQEFMNVFKDQESKEQQVSLFLKGFLRGYNRARDYAKTSIEGVDTTVHFLDGAVSYAELGLTGKKGKSENLGVAYGLVIGFFRFIVPHPKSELSTKFWGYHLIKENVERLAKLLKRYNISIDKSLLKKQIVRIAKENPQLEEGKKELIAHCLAMLS